MSRVRQRQIRRTLLNVDDEASEISELARTRIDYPVINPKNPISGIPFGLELLENTERLLIRPQELPHEDFEALTDHTHYDIIDLDAGKIYFAWESDVTGYGRERLYTLSIVDYASRPILKISNYSNCMNSCTRIFNCFGSTGHLVKVNKPDGTRVAELIQKYNTWTPKFILKNEYGKPIITIQGPKGAYCWGSSWATNAVFPIISNKNEERIGCITRGSSDPLESVDTFEIIFPRDLKVEEKAGLLGSVFSINSMFFDRSTNPDIVEISEDKEQEDLRYKRASSYKEDLDELGLDDDGKPILGKFSG